MAKRDNILNVSDVGEAVLGLRERKKLRTRATLIDAAVELCIDQGFERTTVDQIAAIADVSPRTFSRYFATKDAVVMALVDEVVQVIAEELTRQPADLSPLEALYRAHVAMYRRAKTASPGGMTSERLLATMRIVLTSPTLRHSVSEFRMHASHAALAARMGVALDDRRLKLVRAVWSAIIMTALGDLVPVIDWEKLTIEDIVNRLEDTYAEFIHVVEDARQLA
jgi:AcrR family transcriptional regulator